ncbi:MAG TPA: 1-acyl-sn-glycerol-3-phosphate acyltransferase [Candidatus Obscuribacterales bacterium]
MPFLPQYAQHFVPPRENQIATAVCKYLLLPFYLKMEGTKVRTSSETLEFLHQLRDVPTVIVPNHSDRYDPLVVFTLSKISKEDFFYAAARETFDEDSGWRGALFQNIGAYSVIRGAHDLTYVHATVDLILTKRRKVVMFAEGEVTGRDGYIQPLKKDGLGCVFLAQRALAKAANGKPPESVFILPLSIYYQVNPEAEELLSQALGRMEKELGLQSSTASPEDRVNAIALAIVSGLETYYGLPGDSDLPFLMRVKLLTRHFCAALSEFTGQDLNWSKSETSVLHTVAASLREPLWAKKLKQTPYGKQLQGRAGRRSESLREDFDRIQRLMVIANSIQESLTLETLWRLVDCLEQEVLGATSWKGRRTAWVEAAEPINLQQYWAAYQADRDAALQQVSELVQNSIQKRLHKMKERTQQYDRVEFA